MTFRLKITWSNGETEIREYPSEMERFAEAAMLKATGYSVEPITDGDCGRA